MELWEGLGKTEFRLRSYAGLPLGWNRKLCFVPFPSDVPSAVQPRLTPLPFLGMFWRRGSACELRDCYSRAICV